MRTFKPAMLVRFICKIGLARSARGEGDEDQVERYLREAAESIYFASQNPLVAGLVRDVSLFLHRNLPEIERALVERRAAFVTCPPGFGDDEVARVRARDAKRKGRAS